VLTGVLNLRLLAHTHTHAHNRLRNELQQVEKQILELESSYLKTPQTIVEKGERIFSQSSRSGARKG
jgi:flagellar biosynthesis chaperone FliJ